MLRPGVGVAALVLLLPGCAGGEGHANPSVPASGGSAATAATGNTSTAPAALDPKALLVSLVTGLLSGPGFVDTEVTRMSSPIVSYEASYDEARGLVQGALSLHDPSLSGSLEDLRLLFLGGTRYLRVRSDCWLAVAAIPDRGLAAALPAGTALDVVRATEATSYDAFTSRLAGRVPAQSVVALFEASVPLSRLTSGHLSGSVPVSFPVQDDGSIAELDIEGRDLATAVRATAHLSDSDVRYLDHIAVRIRFGDQESSAFPLDPPTAQQLADSTTSGCMSEGTT